MAMMPSQGGMGGMPPEMQGIINQVVGLCEEGTFVNEIVQNGEATEASQYGAVFYPSASSAFALSVPGHAGVAAKTVDPGVTVFANLTGMHTAPTTFSIHAAAT